MVLRWSRPQGKRPATQAGTVTSTVASIVEVNQEEPDEAALARALEVLRGGGVLAFPTDTLYGIGCALGQTASAERIQNLRGIDPNKRPFTFLLPDIGELPHYAVVNESAYRVLSRIFPGPYCAELVASRKMVDSAGLGERATIGVRIPQSRLCEKLLWRLGRPLLTVTAKSADGRTLTTAKMIQEEYRHQAGSDPRRGRARGSALHRGQPGRRMGSRAPRGPGPHRQSAEPGLDLGADAAGRFLRRLDEGGHRSVGP